jgi:hypothetical protein
MNEHTRDVSGQRLSKHFPDSTQQILNNATVGLQQWKSCVFHVGQGQLIGGEEKTMKLV